MTTTERTEDGRLTRERIDEIWGSIADQQKRIRKSLPTEQHCLRAMMDAYIRLKELGWNDIIYCPKDGTVFDSISFGSTGIHPAHYDGEWPTGLWWVHDGGDLWPDRPVMYRRDRDASLAEDAKRLSGEAVAARAEGIAQGEDS